MVDCEDRRPLVSASRRVVAQSLVANANFVVPLPPVPGENHGTKCNTLPERPCTVRVTVPFFNIIHHPVQLDVRVMPVTIRVYLRRWQGLAQAVRTRTWVGCLRIPTRLAVDNVVERRPLASPAVPAQPGLRHLLK